MSDDIKPYRMQMNFTGAHADPEVLEEIYDAVVEEAERRGIFFEYGFGPAEMDREDVIPDSPLHQVITGREAGIL